MKPLLIKTDKDGNLKITLEELQKMIDESYNAGYYDGQKNATPWYQPITVPTTTPGVTWDKYEITCSSKE